MATRTKSATKAPATKKAPAAKKTPAKRTAPMKKSTTKKAPAKSAPVKQAATVKTAGGARSNPVYVSKVTDRKMHEDSGRSKVHAFVAAAGAKGIDRESIEEHFDADESVNVTSSLGYLVKFGMMLKVEKL